jgi:hypothetical protein
LTRLGSSREDRAIETPPAPKADENRLLLAGILLVYAGLIGWLGLHHEPWRDEADSWLMARDASLGELFRIMGAAGTPSLWYLVQLPFAKAGLPFATQAILNGLISVAAAGVFLFRARLPLALRIGFLFGYFMAFEYSVVARSYALSLLLLFGAAALFARRAERPIAVGLAVGLAANTNAHSFFIASSFTALLLWECRAAHFRGAPRAALLVASAGVLGAFVQLIPPADGQMTGLVEAFGPGNLLRGISLAFVPTQAGVWALAFGALVLGAGLLSLLASPKALFFTCLAYAGLTYLFVFKYGGFIRHFGFLLIVLLLGLWLGAEEPPGTALPERFGFRTSPEQLATVRRAAFALLGASLAVSVYFASVTWRTERTKHFSEAFELADYLKREGLSGRRIAANQAGWTTAILAYFPALAFYYPGLDDTRTFMRWDRKYRDAALLPHAEAVRRVKARFPDWSDARRGVLLVVGNGDLEQPETHGYRLRYATSNNLFEHFDERFYLYEPIP